MSGVVIDTPSYEFALTNPTANIATNGFTNPVPKTATPSGDGVLAFGHGGSQTSSGLILVPFGVGSDTNTFSMNVYGWRPLPGPSGAAGGASTLNLWVPVLLASFTACTLDSGMPGVAGTQEGATAFFCSDITLNVGNSGISVEVVSPTHANNQIAHVVIDVKGFRFAEVQFSTGGSATSCNALWVKM